MTQSNRILNFLLLLLHTERPLTRAEIMQSVDYGSNSKNETNRRLFERDKALLTELGMALSVKILPSGEYAYSLQNAEPPLVVTEDEVALIEMLIETCAENDDPKMADLMLKVQAMTVEDEVVPDKVKEQEYQRIMKGLENGEE